jgi:zinc transporter ZupT
MRSSPAIGLGLGGLGRRARHAAVVSAVQATAAGAILTMVVDTMVPEAFEGTHDYAGIIAVAGFLCAFALSKMA